MVCLYIVRIPELDNSYGICAEIIVTVLILFCNCVKYHRNMIFLTYRVTTILGAMVIDTTTLIPPT